MHLLDTIFVISHQFRRKVNECCFDHVTEHVTIMASTVGLRQNTTWKANIHESFVTIGRTVMKIELFLFLTQFFFLDPGLKQLENSNIRKKFRKAMFSVVNTFRTRDLEKFLFYPYQVSGTA